MKRNIQLIILTLFLFLAPSLFAQEVSPKREFRGAWLSTVWAIDWPTHRDNDANAEKDQKIQMREILDRYVRANINVCFFQVRGFSDAFYNSAYEPWSQYLCGERGKAPNYDPFQFVIDEAHARGIEVHAWINPYRYATSADNYGTLPTDYANTHPDWLIDAGGTVILNPGIPEVRQRIVDIVKDILSKYNVDGIVFDDYFYPNGAMHDRYDDEQYVLYNPNNLSRADWRREQVNLMVADVYKAVKDFAPWCRFGIGPAGVAASSKEVADKYGVTPCPGIDWQYNGIYSDPLAWISSNTIDYISPQVYWTIGSSSDYAKITPWWGMVAHKFGRHNYVSASLSSLQSEPRNVPQKRMPAVTNYYPQETVDEILINRASAKENAPGMVFFSSNKLSTVGFINKLVDNVYTHKALPPVLTWFRAPEQGMVTNLTLTGQILSWDYADTRMRYGVYAIPKAERHDRKALSTMKYFLGMTYTTSFALPADVSVTTHDFAVTVIDRYANEYAMRFLSEPLAADVTPQLLFPADNADILLPTMLTWQPVADASGYTVNLAYDAQFNNIIAVAQVDSAAFSTQQFAKMNGDKCYWRVLAHVPNAKSNYSETRSFSGKVFALTVPQDGESEVSVAPTIAWDNAGADASYLCEISDESTFRATNIVYSATAKTNRLIVPADVLKYSTNYYVRITATTQLFTITSSTVMFTTEDIVMVPPAILSPYNETTVTSQALRVTVSDTPNNGFRFECSTTESFPKRGTKIIQTAIGERTVEFEGLAEGEYYLRAATRITAATYTDFSPVVKVTYKIGTAIEDVSDAIAYVVGNRLYASEGQSYTVYSVAGTLLVSGITTADVTILPALPQGIYCLRLSGKTLKFMQ